MEDDLTSLDLGGARLELRPLEPMIWQQAAAKEPGLARLALGLLRRSQVRWRGVRGGKSAREDGWAEANEDDLARLPAAAAGPLLDALCAPWLTSEEEAGLERFQAFVDSARDYPGLSCAACHEQEKLGEGSPDCTVCPRLAAPPGAGPVLDLAGVLAGLPEPGWAAPLLIPARATPRERRLLLMRLTRVWGRGREEPPGGGRRG